MGEKYNQRILSREPTKKTSPNCCWPKARTSMRRTTLKAVSFISLFISHLVMAQHCADIGKIQAESEISDFKTSHCLRLSTLEKYGVYTTDRGVSRSDSDLRKRRIQIAGREIPFINVRHRHRNRRRGERPDRSGHGAGGRRRVNPPKISRVRVAPRRPKSRKLRIKLPGAGRANIRGVSKNILVSSFIFHNATKAAAP